MKTKTKKKKPARVSGKKVLPAKGKSKTSKQPKPKSKKPKAAAKTLIKKKKTSRQPKRSTSRPLKRVLSPKEVKHKNNLELFTTAIKLLGDGTTSKAKHLFEKLANTATPDLAERARVYLSICKKKTARPRVDLKTVEDFYNNGIRLANEGDAPGAMNYLLEALKLDPKCDYIYYAVATTHAVGENADGALEYLQKAIQINGKNRILAQKDPDFFFLEEDPRFTELLYPEPPTD